MSLSVSHPALRWAAPAAVVAIVLGAAAVTSVTAEVTPSLPTRSAAELLVDVQNADMPPLSGTVTQTAELGLPDLPVQLGTQGSSSFTALVSGTHTLRVWYGGEDQQRLALLGTLGESDLVRNGTDVWVWASDSNTATHYQLPPRSAQAAEPDPGLPAMTPQEAADAALAAIDPTTTVTTDGTAEVAGRAAYELVLAPKGDTASLIGQVRIAIDAEHHIPLRVRVLAKGVDDPAFEVGFTEIGFDAPGVEQFRFSPPPGATITDSTADQAVPDPDPGATPVEPRPAEAAAVAEPRIVGAGWTSVLVAPMAAALTATPGDPGWLEQGGADQGAAEPVDPGAVDQGGASPTGADQSGADQSGAEQGGAELGRVDQGDPESGGAEALDVGAVLGSLPQVSGPWGSGRLLTSALFSVLVTDDGRVIAGAVRPELLYEAAAQ